MSLALNCQKQNKTVKLAVFLFGEIVACVL